MIRSAHIVEHPLRLVFLLNNRNKYTKFGIYTSNGCPSTFGMSNARSDTAF